MGKLTIKLVGMLAIVMLAGCGESSPKRNGGKNGMYHWKTTFDPTPYEREFLKKHDVERLFIKFFDVDVDNEYSDDSRPVPVATTRFVQQPDSAMEVVPVVFITVPAISKMAADSAVMARKLVDRIEAMCLANGIKNVKEVQLDCDWTQTTRNAYYTLCREVGKLLHERKLRLSSTIRLHQLRQAPPPVDRGTLMLYNTGSLGDFQSENAILTAKDVEPYLKGTDYKLPLDFAYPDYSWTVVYDGDGNYFRKLLPQRVKANDSTLVEGDGHWLRATKDFYLGEEPIDSGCYLRLDESHPKEILRAKELVGRKLASDEPYTIIIYHLDSTNLSHFSHAEINRIYR